MSDDLVSLRILLVSDSMPDRDLLRRAAAQVAVPVDVLEADDVAGARPQLAISEIDIVFVSSAISDSDRTAFIADCRAKRPQPFVIIVAAAKAEADGLSSAGADSAIVKPSGPGEAKALVERCIRMRMPKRILVVDDSQTMRGIVRKILAASRFKVEVGEAQEGIEALKLLASGTFDLVFLDYNMPGLNGVETLSEIRRQYPRLGVVLMTSNAEEDLAQRARMAGAAAFLKKPFYPSDIDAILQSMLGPRGVN
jgi:DNA-binding response OmpR family regulator